MRTANKRARYGIVHDSLFIRHRESPWTDIYYKHPCISHCNLGLRWAEMVTTAQTQGTFYSLPLLLMKIEWLLKEISQKHIGKGSAAVSV